MGRDSERGQVRRGNVSSDKDDSGDKTAIARHSHHHQRGADASRRCV